MAQPFQQFETTRVRGEVRQTGVECAATEEPLEVRLHGRPFAVIMRTPGADRELAAGFLLAEGVVTGVDDLGLIEHCTAGSGEHAENVVNVTLMRGDVERLLLDRRRIDTNASCGLCGRLTIASLRSSAPDLLSTMTVVDSTLKLLPDRLRAAQTVFDETGGLHAAGLFTADARLRTMAEDVGRHNAVDKVIGRMLLQEALPLDGHLLFVSGRASFEIVQKALIAGIPIVASVSAPSTLAIELAVESGVTLIGFLRGENFNIYSHAERIVAAAG